MVSIELQMINPTFFYGYLKEQCQGNQFCGKITHPLYLSQRRYKTEFNIAT